MDEKSLRRLAPALLAVGCLAFNSSVHAQEFFFTFKSKASDRCLHVRGGDEPNGGEVRVFDPCQTLPEFRVERLSEILRIKITPQNFKCLQVKQPLSIDDLPVRVTPGNCVAPVSNWFVGSPDNDGFRTVILRSDDVVAGLCMQEKLRPPPRTSEVVVDLCDESSKWKLDSVPPPF
jgi:hypothetical protein